MPSILAFDTATGPCSVAVWKGGKIAFYLENAAPVMQSARLMPMIEQALKETGTAYKQLSGIACTIGPGSFTGIRVALATARGLCLASGIKGMGFSTLEVLAMSARKSGTSVLALLTAGKGEHYYQGFDHLGKPLFEPKVGVLEAAATAMPAGFVTIGNATLENVTAIPVSFPRADALSELAASGTTAASLAPFYIRLPDAIPLNPLKSVL